MDALLLDLRYALRTLARGKGVTLAALLALALGIGATSALFSVIDAVLLRPSPWKEPARMVSLTGDFPHHHLADVPLSWSEYQDTRRLPSLEASGAWLVGAATLARGDRAERVKVGYVDPAFFGALGVSPALGRGFGGDEVEAGRSSVALLSDRMFHAVFHGDPGALGQKLRLDGDSVTVVGVLPRGFEVGSEEPALWVPLGLTPEARSETSRGSRYLSVVGRLRGAATLADFRRELASFSAALRAEHPKNYHGTDWHLSAVGLDEQLVGGARKSLWLLLGAVALVLLIACGNVANLLLARAAGRQREIAVRAALGAGRARLMRQLFTESAVLALAGGAAGLLLAGWGVDLLVALAPPGVPGIHLARLDLRVALFTLLVSLATGLLFGLAPALHGARADLAAPLKDGQRAGSRGGRLRSALVVSEVALALVLLVGAGLLLRSFAQVLSVPAGFETVGVISAHFTPSGTRYQTAGGEATQSLRQLIAELIRRAEALPGAEAVGAINILPLTGRSDRSYSIEGRSPPPGLGPDSEWRTISPGFFASVKAGLAGGRDFTLADDERAPKVVIINEALARQHFPGEDPVGKRLRVHAKAPEDGWRTIVGVVRDYRERSLDEEPRAQLFLPLLQWPDNDLTFTLRGRQASPAALLALGAAFRAELLKLDPEQAVELQTFAQAASNSIAPRRFPMQLLAIFAGLSLLLAAIGIYGVMSYSVAQRTHEMGVRRAVGASSGDVVGLVVRQGLRLALVGVGVGTALALALARLIAGFLYGVSAADPLTFTGIAALLVVVALVACWLPARRAAAVDPMVALRAE